MFLQRLLQAQEPSQIAILPKDTTTGAIAAMEIGHALIERSTVLLLVNIGILELVLGSVLPRK